jgi:hypothetical protein
MNLHVLDVKGISGLTGRREARKGELNIREGPTMFLKKKENRSDNLDGPTISSKTKGLVF